MDRHLSCPVSIVFALDTGECSGVESELVVACVRVDDISTVVGAGYFPGTFARVLPASQESKPESRQP